MDVVGITDYTANINNGVNFDVTLTVAVVTQGIFLGFQSGTHHLSHFLKFARPEQFCGL